MPPRNRQEPSQEVAIPTEQIDAFGKQMLIPRKGSFDRLLPDTVDADAFVGLAMAALYKAPKTAAVALRNPESLLLALRECAGLGLLPGTDEYALTVRKGAVVGIIQYQGEIKRMFNFGTVRSIHADVICPGETFRKQDPWPPLHVVPDWNARDTRVDIIDDPGADEPVRRPNLLGVYAYAMLNDGQCSRVVHMGRAEVMRHRAMAGHFDIWDGPFGQSQWLKTAVHELEKWVPRASSFQRRDAAVQMELARRPSVDAVAPRSDPPTGERMPAPADAPTDVVDGEEVNQDESRWSAGADPANTGTAGSGPWPSVGPQGRTS